MKLRDSGPKILDEEVSRALQMEVMYQLESCCSKGSSRKGVTERRE